VFISYRREGDAAIAALVQNSIESGFHGSHDIEVKTFLDVRQRLGVDWAQGIQAEVARADVVVAIIGPGWLAAHDQHYQRRIDQEDDWVRQELEMALTQKKTIIPLLVDGTLMPGALPASLAPMAASQGLPIRTTSFASDVQPLLREIQEQAAHLRHAAYTRSPEYYRETRWPYPDPPLVVKPAQMSDEDIAIALREIIPEWSSAPCRST